MSRTKTLLDGVNEVLIRVGQLDSGRLLVSLVSTSQQRFIDQAVGLWLDSIQDIYTLSKRPAPTEVREAEPPIVLQEDRRDYALPDNLVQIRWPIEDRETGLRIYQYPGGFEQMRRDQRIPSMWKGLPIRACINPIDRTLWMERYPTAAEAGRVYTLTYDADMLPKAASDIMPFEDNVFQAMVPLVAMLWENAENGTSTSLGRIGYGRAARLLSGEQVATHY